MRAFLGPNRRRSGKIAVKTPQHNFLRRFLRSTAAFVSVAKIKDYRDTAYGSNMIEEFWPSSNEVSTPVFEGLPESLKEWKPFLGGHLRTGSRMARRRDDKFRPSSSRFQAVISGVNYDQYNLPKKPG